MFNLRHVKKTTVFEAKSLEKFANEERKTLALQRILTIVAAVDECILLAGVAVQITEKKDLTTFLNTGDELFEMKHLSVVYLRWVLPFLVEVITRQIAAVVAMDDTIRVKHGHDLEHKVLPQFLGLWTIRE